MMQIRKADIFIGNIWGMKRFTTSCTTDQNRTQLWCVLQFGSEYRSKDKA